MTTSASPDPLALPSGGPTRTVTISDVAREAGVSVMTVSNVVNGKPNVRPQTRQRVLDAVERSGYRVNPLARALAGGQGRMLSVVTDRLNLPYVTEVLQGAGQAAEALDYDLAILMMGGRVSPDLSVMSQLSAGALLIQPSFAGGQRLGGLRRADLPRHTVSIDGPGERTLSVDNYGGARQAMRHLLELGHTRIGFISGLGAARPGQGGESLPDTERDDASERLRGYRDAMREAGLRVPRGYVQEGDYRKRSGELATERLLNLSERPTALFVSSDAMAVGAIHVAQDRGLKVPDDLSVIGFDGLPIAAESRPQLSTVRQPLQRLGGAAVQMLVQLSQGQLAPQPPPFATELLVRDSTAPPPLHRHPETR
ncbi:LacI family DNA-binding transcriptional regulator [Deinococcus sp.]|uniref:LacI family DNA-binding transcriptional regulator n=1 Tax=Deinococcus sp. TaxID=47478 RepID=UPI003CC5032D